jgi:hypothetical protein
MFRKAYCLPSLEQNMEPKLPSETLITIYGNREDNNMSLHRCDNFRSHISSYIHGTAIRPAHACVISEIF